MGKRELLLLVVFVVLGVGVYQVTAPAAPAQGEGFSLGRLVQFAKAHFHGARARREITRTATLTPEADVTTLEIGELSGLLVVEAADRSDISATLTTVLAGIDDQDLDAQERQLGLSALAKGKIAAIEISTPEGRRGPKSELRVEIPRGLKVQISGRSSAEIRGVAGLHLDDFEGSLSTEDLTGPITGEAGAMRAEIGPGAVLDLRTGPGRLHAESPASVNLVSERTTIDIVEPEGPVTIEQEYARMDVRGTGGPVKIGGEGGVITLREVTHPLTIDARRLTVTAELAAPVTTTIKVDDDEVEVDLPREGGVQLEASITDGELRLPPGFTSTTTERGASVSAAVAGGGPLVKIEVDGGQLRIRSRAKPGT